jgi:ketosteroid isomerase-like protein
MTATPGNAVEEAQIRTLIDDRVRTVRAKDVNGALSSIAPEILSFDVVNPLQHIGSDSSRKRAEDWFSSFQGPIGYEIRNLNVTAGDDVAFSHGLSHVSATSKDSLKQLEKTRGFARNHRKNVGSTLEKESL